MPNASDKEKAAEWNRLREDSVHAVEELLGQLRLDSGETVSQDLLDAYLYAKRLLAAAMQALQRMDLPDRYEPFHQMRRLIEAELSDRYGQLIPSVYLAVPYGSRLHEQLFTLLAERGEIQADELRVITADAVHAERRARELRELGVRIVTVKSSGSDVYRLDSLELDDGRFPTIVKNNILKAKLPKDKESALLAKLGF